MCKEVIIILGSTIKDSGEISDIGLGRLYKGLGVLKENPDSKIILTGGFGNHFNNTNKPYYYYASEFLKANGVKSENILAKLPSKDTVEDAQFSLKILENYNPKKVFVVTSSFHMKRVKYIFKNVFYNFKLKFISHEYIGNKVEMDSLMKTESKEMYLLSNYRKSSLGSKLDTEIYNNLAYDYNLYRKPFNKLIDNISKEIKDISIDGKVIELGCGTGKYIKAISDKIHEDLIGVDFSKEMIDLAKERTKCLILKENLNTQISIKNNIAKFIYNINFIHCIVNLQSFYDDCYRILNFGGQIYTATHSEIDYKKNTLGVYFPETIKIETNITPSINKIKDCMSNVGFKEIEFLKIKDTYVIDNNFYLACKNKVFSALNKISETSLRIGLDKLRNDTLKNNNIGVIYYSIIIAKKK